MISPKNKLRLRKWILMTLRALVWRADEWLHRAELRLREDLEAAKKLTLPTVVRSAAKPGLVREPKSHPLARVTFLEWEARKSGVRPAVKARRGRQRHSAADFDRELQERVSRSAS